MFRFRQQQCISLCLLSFLLLLGACADLKQADEADRSAFGTYVYRLDTLQLRHSLQQVLQADTSHWRADQTVRQHYQQILADHPSDPPAFLWSSRMGVSPDADSLLSHLRLQLPRQGLDSAAFFVPQIARDLEIVHRLAFDSLGVDINELLPRLDYHLSRAYLRYTTGLRFGFLRPARLFNRLDYKVGSPDYARLFDYDPQAPDYDASLGNLTAPSLRMDYLRQSIPTGSIYQTLSQKLEQAKDPEERRTLAINLERLRWQMPQPATEGRRIFVNIPAQQLWAIAPDSVMTMRICCGSVLTKTPLLQSSISHMQVNPDNAPPAIPSHPAASPPNNCEAAACAWDSTAVEATASDASSSASPTTLPFTSTTPTTPAPSSASDAPFPMVASASSDPSTSPLFCCQRQTTGPSTACVSPWISRQNPTADANTS